MWSVSVPDRSGSWVPSTLRLVLRLQSPLALCIIPAPPYVLLLAVCNTARHGSVLYAHKRVHRFLAVRQCPAVAFRSASVCARAFASVSSALIAFFKQLLPSSLAAVPAARHPASFLSVPCGADLLPPAAGVLARLGEPGGMGRRGAGRLRRVWARAKGLCISYTSDTTRSCRQSMAGDDRYKHEPQ